MLYLSVLLSCLVTCVLTKDSYFDRGSKDLDDVVSLFPDLKTEFLSLRKRELLLPAPKTDQSDTTLQKAQTENKPQIQSEGQPELKPLPSIPTVHEHIEAQTTVNDTIKGNATQNANVTTVAPTVTQATTLKPVNNTAPKAPSHQADLSNPGVMKRGLIVFGGFALMAVAYFIFYRRKGKNNETNNTHGTNDNNQFRYGVLQSDDRRDNLELSRIPLTMESDEDEDEDLEIFDLEQKKKSLSYVNLQVSDDYVVHESREDGDRNNLLLDIEDANSDTLINWSSNGNKSIL
ncbi:uncharacterized protein [Epargyreus clarus]|uniref:uncharacterized protein n=1 Tax=Epargyreus clarus TaxID=520877 RepID=UPI003C303FC3